MRTLRGRVHSLQVSDGGVPKCAVAELRVGSEGAAGDRQRDLRNHGGRDRAICLWSLEIIQALRAEGHDLVPGAAGENVTVAGLRWEAVGPGARVELGGDVVLEVTAHAGPCRNLRDLFIAGRIARISQAKHPGVSRLYARVKSGGAVHAGDSVTVRLASAGAIGAKGRGPDSPRKRGRSRRR